MKRFILGLLMLVGVTLAAAPAFAGSIMTTETLNWRFANGQTYSASAPASQYQVAKKALIYGASVKDTTTWVSTEGWFVPEQTATGADSVLVGQFVIVQDSTTASGFGTNKSVTVTVNGSFNAVEGDAPYNTYSLSINTTDGGKVLTIPIWIKHGVYVSSPNPAKNQWGGLPPYLRLIISTASGNDLPAARIFVQHLKPVK